MYGVAAQSLVRNRFVEGALIASHAKDFAGAQIARYASMIYPLGVKLHCTHQYIRPGIVECIGPVTRSALAGSDASNPSIRASKRIVLVDEPLLGR